MREVAHQGCHCTIMAYNWYCWYMSNYHGNRGTERVKIEWPWSIWTFTICAWSYGKLPSDFTAADIGPLTPWVPAAFVMQGWVDVERVGCLFFFDKYIVLATEKHCLCQGFNSWLCNFQAPSWTRIAVQPVAPTRFSQKCKLCWQTVNPLTLINHC